MRLRSRFSHPGMQQTAILLSALTLKRGSIARLSHPNIVTIHDFSEQDGHLYIVMQLVDGGTLKHLLDTSERPVKYEAIKMTWMVRVR